MDIALETMPDSWTLVDALRIQVQSRGNAPYITFDSGTTCSFAELDAKSDACAAGLAQLGVGPGDRVVIMAQNGLAFLLAFWGVQKRRAVLVPINTELKGEFLARQLHDCQPKIIISDQRFGDVPPETVASVEAFVGVGDEVRGPAGKPSTSFAELCRTGGPAAALAPAPSDICLILYTSGTSGLSKGVLVPQAHAYLFGLQQARALALSGHDCFFIALPMFHVNALLMSLGSCLLTGARAFVVTKFSASRWLEQVRVSGATVTNCLGIMAEFILRQPKTAGDRDHELRTVMAVPVSAQWGASFEERFGVRLRQVYGMTECNIVSFSDPCDALEPGCVGPLSTEFFDVAVVDPDTDRPIEQGGVGEIVVRPKIANAFMHGYYGLPEATVSAWRNLWFHTGDAGRLDSSGRLHFIDRLGDCIRRRGENISSSEIEQVLATHQGIAECAVVGVRVEGAGGEDEVKACVVALAGSTLQPSELFEWAKARLPRYAVPRFWELTEALEKTPTGKVKKRELRSAGVTAATWDREQGSGPQRGPLEHDRFRLPCNLNR